jgi:hypothetical protein
MWHVEDPTQHGQGAHKLQLRCQPYAKVALYPPQDFLILIPVSGWGNPCDLLRSEGLGKLNKSNEFVSTLTRHFSVCSIAPQLLMLTLDPMTIKIRPNISCVPSNGLHSFTFCKTTFFVLIELCFVAWIIFVRIIFIFLSWSSCYEPFKREQKLLKSFACH